MKSVGAWVKRHPIWSGLIILVVALIAYQMLKPKTYDYVYVSETVTRGEVVRKVTASGKLRALNTIKVGAEVSGQVSRVAVDFNTPVKAGQVLAEIDPTRLRARVEQARAQVATAEASLATANAAAGRASSDVGIQSREYERRKQLAGRGFTSQASLDAAGGSLATAEASRRSSTAQIATARAQIVQARAELSSAMLDLLRTRIIAPTSGVVINRLVEPGSTVAASFQTPNLFEIAADTSRMQVETSVDEADIGEVQTGQSVSFTVDAYPRDRFKAVVRQIRKAAVETNNVVSYLVILDVDNKDGKLLPGMTANVEIVTGRIASALRVPTTALRFRPKVGDRPTSVPPKGSETVYLAGSEPYQPTRKVVKTGLAGEEYVEVRSGLKAGDKVLVRTRSTDPKTGGDEDDSDEEVGVD